MTRLLFAINTETVHSSIETTCYLLCILFSAIAVIPSLDIVLIEPFNSTLSDNGSCLHIHASRYGHKVQGALESDNNSIYQFYQDKNIIPLINNKRRKSIESKTGESINSDGIPVCSLQSNHDI